MRNGMLSWPPFWRPTMPLQCKWYPRLPLCQTVIWMLTWLLNTLFIKYNVVQVVVVVVVVVSVTLRNQKLNSMIASKIKCPPANQQLQIVLIGESFIPHQKAGHVEIVAFFLMGGTWSCMFFVCREINSYFCWTSEECTMCFLCWAVI